MRHHRQAKKTRDRRGLLANELDRLRDARTQSARLAIIDELGKAFGNRPDAIGATFRELLAESQRRGNHRQQLRLLNDYFRVLTTAVNCSNGALDTLNETLQQIEQSAEDA